MPTFRYSAYRADGKNASGVLEADNLRDAQQRLRQEGLLAHDIKPAASSTGKNGIGSWRRRIPLPELALMTRRLATLLGSAVPVYETIITLHAQERPGELRNLLERLRERLAEGASLAKAMAAEPQVFSESYISMVTAGEASGALETVLEKLADFLEDQEAIRSKVTTSLAYPILMMVVGSGVMLFLLAFVVPKIITVFQESKATLPLITVLLIKVSNFLQHWWWLLILLLCAAAIAYDRLRRQERFRLMSDQWLLRLPLAGELVKRLVLARFAKVLGLLLASGVPIIKALEITGEVVVNRQYRSLLSQVREELVQGGSLSAGLSRSTLFPPLLTHMIGVGEKGGTLEEMLAKAGSAYEREFETSIGRMMALLEPLLVLGMGLCVGLVVVAVLLPIFQLNQLIK